MFRQGIALNATLQGANDALSHKWFYLRALFNLRYASYIVDLNRSRLHEDDNLRRGAHDIASAMQSLVPLIGETTANAAKNIKPCLASTDRTVRAAGSYLSLARGNLSAHDPVPKIETIRARALAKVTEAESYLKRVRK
jgi:hypothetical protein